MNHTPDHVDTWQLAYLQNSLEEQDVTLTRDEFIARKRHLAVMRRHLPTPVEESA